MKSGVNFLILDEPTNHLDMQSKDVLKEAIKAFNGTVVVVSHDREFLDGLVEKVYEFGGGKVKEHLGGIYDFLQAKKIESLDELNKMQNAEPKVGGRRESQCRMQNQSHPDKKNKEQGDASNNSASCIPHSALPMSYEARKEIQKRINKIEKQLASCEGNIEKLESRQAELDEILMDPAHASDMKLVNEYTELQEKLSTEMSNWEDLAMQLEEWKEKL